ncbi:MAG: hypothetical protein M3R49_07640 [Chloroflexota bacterium]|nr:hypothetical protein [Chloroflexota bacterium]
MSAEHRLWVLGLVGLGVLAGVGLVAFAANTCPVELPGQPCPDAQRNVVVVVVLAAASVALLVTPFAFLAELLVQRRIVYRGAWWRAGRRGGLAGLLVATLAGLRLGGALSVPAFIFIVVLAIVVERFLTSRGG